MKRCPSETSRSLLAGALLRTTLAVPAMPYTARDGVADRDGTADSWEQANKLNPRGKTARRVRQTAERMRRVLHGAAALLAACACVAAGATAAGAAGKPVIDSGSVDFPRENTARISAVVHQARRVTVVVTGGTVDRSDPPPRSCADLRVRWGRPGPKLKLKRVEGTTWSVDTSNRRVDRAISSEVQRFVFTADNGAGTTVRTMVKNTLCG